MYGVEKRVYRRRARRWRGQVGAQITSAEGRGPRAGTVRRPRKRAERSQYSWLLYFMLTFNDRDSHNLDAKNFHPRCGTVGPKGPIFYRRGRTPVRLAPEKIGAQNRSTTGRSPKRSRRQFLRQLSEGVSLGIYSFAAVTRAPAPEGRRHTSLCVPPCVLANSACARQERGPVPLRGRALPTAPQSPSSPFLSTSLYSTRRDLRVARARGPLADNTFSGTATAAHFARRALDDMFDGVT
ncbi:hypothetical protein EVAR_42621_1 [Eumeta japonica]|uniref:Uncharacterized protein n=1 Tax=Eumeta variegata TaxID=151549 RepID=A0A4C1WZH7_EUMVA|nr:hypothetical protein EVAR_42621_1 [Eumeta japonica]